MKNMYKCLSVSFITLLFTMIFMACSNVSKLEEPAKSDNDFISRLNAFTENSLKYVYNYEEPENVVFSPFNFYLTLVSLYEMADKDVGSQILEVLEISDVEKNTSEISNALAVLEKTDNETYSRFKEYQTRLDICNSLWLGDMLDSDSSLIDDLTENFKTEVYRGDFDDSEFLCQMSDWVYKNTNKKIKPNPDTNYGGLTENSFFIQNTILFSDEWKQLFFDYEPDKRIFHCNNTEEIICNYMTGIFINHPYIREDSYTSTVFDFKQNGTKMIIILPDKRKTVYDLLSEKGLMAQLLSDWSYNTIPKASLTVRFPKYSCESNIELTDVAKRMGIEQIFEEGNGAFFKIGDKLTKIQGIKQSAKVRFTANGCATGISTDVTIQEEEKELEKIELVLDRPFIYILTKENIPFLVGVFEAPHFEY